MFICLTPFTSAYDQKLHSNNFKITLSVFKDCTYLLFVSYQEYFESLWKWMRLNLVMWLVQRKWSIITITFLVILKTQYISLWYWANWNIFQSIQFRYIAVNIMIIFRFLERKKSCEGFFISNRKCLSRTMSTNTFIFIPFCRN